MDCVVCGSRSTCEIATFRPSISSDLQVLDAAVENRLCEICGAVFNAGGARGGLGGGCEDHPGDDGRSAEQVDVDLVYAPDPVTYLEHLRAVAVGGRIRVGVPNLELKPDELLINDRRARLTPASLDRLYRRVGFEVLERAASPDRPWLWDLLRPVEARGPAPAETPTQPDAAAVDRARRLCSRHVASICRAQLAFAEMLDELGDLGIAALFGRGALGILELHRCGGRGQGVRYVLDDDPRLRGSRCHGREVHEPEALPRLGLSKVFLAANPGDHERLRSRLLALGMAASDIYP